MGYVAFTQLLLARVAFCVPLDLAILFFSSWFLFWIPLLPISGTWVLAARDWPPQYYFLQSYMEFLLVFAFFIRWIAGRKDKMSYALLALGLVTLPSLLHAATQDHFLMSVFLCFVMIGGAGIYQLYRERMAAVVAAGLVDATVLLWVGLGLFQKLHEGAIVGQPFYLERSGGMWASNHIGGILILLLPLIRRRWLTVLTVLFLCMHLSLGIYVALILYGIGWFLFVRRGAGLGMAVAVFVFVGSLLALSTRLEVARNVDVMLLSRLRVPNLDAPVRELVAESVTGITQDQRVTMAGIAVQMGLRTRLLGIGLGGFRWGLREINYRLEYSNAHDLYLTAFSEGGLLFALGLVALLLFMMRRAFAIHKPVFVALLVWMIYGFYSGEVYEVLKDVTAGDYYTLLFVLAFLMWRSSAAAARPETAEAVGVLSRGVLSSQP